MPEVIHVFSEQDSKDSLLAEVHRLQSSLAAMRQARDFHGASSAYLMQERDRLQKEIEMSKQRVQVPALVDAGLVQRAQEAYGRAAMADSSTRSGIIAALRVAADALLGPVTPNEIVTANVETPQHYGLSSIVNHVLAARRARLLAPAKPTLQEQVEHILTKHFKTIGVVDAAEEVIASLAPRP